MCGRFVQYSDPEIYASHFDLDALCEAKPRYNVAPTQPVLAIRATDQGKRELVPLRWGLVLLVEGTGQPLTNDQRACRDGQHRSPPIATPSGTGAA